MLFTHTHTQTIPFYASQWVSARAQKRTNVQNSHWHKHTFPSKLTLQIYPTIQPSLASYRSRTGILFSNSSTTSRGFIMTLRLSSMPRKNPRYLPKILTQYVLGRATIVNLSRRNKLVGIADYYDQHNLAETKPLSMMMIIIIIIIIICIFSFSTGNCMHLNITRSARVVYFNFPLWTWHHLSIRLVRSFLKNY